MGRIKFGNIFKSNSGKIISILLFFLSINSKIFSQTGRTAEIISKDAEYLNVMDAKGDSMKTLNLFHNLKVSIAKKEFNISDQCFDELLLLIEKTKNKRAASNLNAIIEASFTNKGNYKKALHYFFKLKPVTEKAELNDETGDILDGIGVVYWYQGDYENALLFYKEGIKKRGKDISQFDLSGSYNNIGLVYRRMGDYKKAVEYYTRSLQICIQIKNIAGTADAYNNIGALYQVQTDYYKALYYYEKSLVLRKQTGDSISISISLGNIGSVYVMLHNNKEAEPYLLQSMGISKRLNDLEGVKEVGGNLSMLFEETNRGGEALKYFKESIAARDSLNNEATQQEALRREMEFKFEQEEQKKAIETAAEKKRQQQYTYMVLVVLGIVLIFSFVLYKRFNLTKKQKSIIESQKQLVEEKQKEVMASISYAKRLQEAILPPRSLILEHLPQTFILYKPKDIVAGDFYWIELVGKDYLLIAAADCTGHGVPGALVSVVCSNALNRTVKEFEITEPGKILDKARELVVETFERSENEVKDGMDISLCLLNKKTNVLEWAGANNPLWIAREGKITEFKPDKQAIGKVDKPALYQTHKIQLQKEDCIYIFTDGYADQFGGPKGKKFKYKQLNELLLQVHTMDVRAQKEKLNTELENWKGNLEQVDDVCVIGIKI